MTNRQHVDDVQELCAQLVLRLSYDGAAYAGFARQPFEHIRTVQDELERSLATYLRRPIETVCAGRTDAGVHATAQFVSFGLIADELECLHRDPDRLARALFALLPPDIGLQGVFLAPADFSARFNAEYRSYRYLIRDKAQRHKAALMRGYCWQVKPTLDVNAMNEALAHLIGEHDFVSFCKASSAQQLAHTNRAILSAGVSRQTTFDGDFIAVEITGNAFLHSMVRVIVGSLVEVGRHAKHPDWMREVLLAQDRSQAGPTAPAQGLTLVDVGYPTDLLIRLV